MEFKPTVFTFIVLGGLCAFFCWHIPISVAYWLIGALGLITFAAYQLGKISVTHETEDERLYRKTLAEAVQIEQIATFPSITLFPDIEAELIDLAIKKYLSIGHQPEADELRALLGGKLL